MKRAIIISVALHLVVVVLAIWGVPFLRSEPELIESAVVVDLVELGERTAAPPPAPKVKEQAQPKPEPKVEQPKPEPPKEEPKPKPAPPKEEAAPKPPPPPPELPKPEPKKTEAPPPPPEPKKEPEPKPEPKKEPEPPKQVAEVKPQKKPEPPAKPEPKKEEPKPEPPKEKAKKDEDDPFKDLLKNVEKFRKETPPQQTAQATPSPQPPAASGQGPRVYNAPVAERATMTEIDFIRKQIEDKWLVDPGAVGVKDMVVRLRVTMQPDGTVTNVEVLDRARYAADSAFRAVADSAYRAVFKASPLQYPVQKYETFKVMDLNFSPQSRL